ncbi:MAG: Putative Metal dependent phosphohydrolase [Nitrospira sp.]|nr:DUF3391 domain-containing protein [Nitrospira sp.]ULA58814.1 MAG: Putative Metal dependent phosphohydrolase [Nitrospira sp.]
MAIAKTSDDSKKLDKSDMLVLSPERLRVGMYVDLNCGWFRHPFPRRSFKLSSASQIATIKGLGLSTVLVYPRESDPDPDAEGTPAETAPTSTDVAEPETGAAQEGAATDVDPSFAEQEIPTHGDYHQAVELASETYRQMLGTSTQMMDALTSGSEEGMRSAETMIGGISTLLTNTQAAGTVASAFDPEDIGDASVLHSLNVATLSMMVAQQFDIDQDALQMIGLAGLLLDIGERRIPRHILETRARRSETEHVKYQLHPYLGVEMLRGFPGIPEEVLDVIRSHHERLDGSGYPEKLKGDQISFPTRIVSAVDHYDTLVNSLYAEEALSPAEALATMYKHEKQLFSTEVVVALIHTLGVYPPGTVVSLSDGSFGLVLNINFKNRMKPLVLIYHHGPGQEPHTIDLLENPTLTILRAVPREELPRPIVDFFRLKRWTGYFIQSTVRTA